MGLQTTMTTSLTGMTAAETMIDVVGNNVANANTVGFKQSDTSFATQFLQTQSIGSGPNEGSGGTNPRQIGLGVKVAEITPDFTQGTIEISSNPLDLAIQGEGFFIVQGAQGERLYTRNGQFKTNANNEIVTITGQRVLGFAADGDYVIQPGLVPLTIPLGNAAVAQPTSNLAVKGNLDPNAEVGSVPQQIQSGVLSDKSQEIPDGDDIDLTALARPVVDATTVALGAAAGGVDIGSYEYRISFIDANGREGPASIAKPLAVAANGQTVDITGIPPAPTGMTEMRIYRRNTASGAPAANQQFRQVAEVAIATNYTDTASDASIAAATLLDDSGLGDGSYSYYVTYYNAFGEETRPTALLGPVTTDAANSRRVYLQNIPTPSGDADTGSFNGIRIYRNLANNLTEFRQVGDIAPTDIPFGATTMSFMDTRPDSDIEGEPEINLDGPAISNTTRLTDLVQRDDSDYVTLFQLGELSFTGDKGGRDVATRSMTIGASTTVGDLLDFMENTFGIVQSATGMPTAAYGGAVNNSRLTFTSNMGEENALSVDLTAFDITPTGAATSQPVQALRFEPTGPAANGAGATVDATVYDSLGTPLSVRITTVLEEKSSAGAVYRWIATSDDHHPDNGSIVVGTGTFLTDSNGAVDPDTDARISIDRGDSPAESPLEIVLDFSQIRALTGNDNELNQGTTDGSPAGTLTSFIVTDSGLIQGIFSNGDARDLGQVRMAQFVNNDGLEQVGDNMFRAGVNSGPPAEGNPGANGIGKVSAGAVELSNTDIGQNLIDLILASTQYRGGARVITAVQQLLDELLALRR